MARILKALTAFIAWRWTPCVALIASSLLFVLIAIAVVPTTIGLPGSNASSPEGEAVNVIGDMPRSERPTPPSPRRPLAPAATPGGAGVIMPAPPPPPPAEEKRVEPPAPTPAPTPTQTAEENDQPDTPPAPTPGPPSGRFMSTPLRFLGQAVNKPQGAPGAPGGGEAAPAPAPANPAPPDDER